MDETRNWYSLRATRFNEWLCSTLLLRFVVSDAYRRRIIALSSFGLNSSSSYQFSIVVFVNTAVVAVVVFAVVVGRSKRSDSHGIRLCWHLHVMWKIRRKKKAPEIVLCTYMGPHTRNSTHSKCLYSV